MLQLCLPQKIDGSNRPVYVTSPLLSPKGVSVKRGVRAGPGAGVGNRVYPVLKNAIFGVRVSVNPYPYPNPRLKQHSLKKIEPDPAFY